MASDKWETRRLSVASLFLDPRNPRLGREIQAGTPRDIVQYLFAHDKAIDVAQSIATRGFFPNEPLLAIREQGRVVVVEGNRRLAALKALREPSLLADTPFLRQLERLSRGILTSESIGSVPVTLAPNRRSTDRQVAGRHIGSPVLRWEAQNRAQFILDKVAEGYENDELAASLGFSEADILEARQTKAIADMTKAVTVSDAVRARLDSPHAKVFTTIARVLDSKPGRDYLRLEVDPEHGFRGVANKGEFARAFARLLTDVAEGKASSRTLNTNDNIRDYFKKWPSSERPKASRTSFVPSDIGGAGSSKGRTAPPRGKGAGDRAKRIHNTVIPRDFKIIHGSTRLLDIRKELTRLRRDRYPNAGAVLMRVFVELTVIDYLDRTRQLAPIVARLKAKNVNAPFGVPTLKQLSQDIVRIAKDKLTVPQANSVQKVFAHDADAPFTIGDLHGFVHQASALPGERDILAFWVRVEPLLRMMVTEPGPVVS